MSKKTPRRKLIGFIAGEKGSIGKLQALILGVSGLIVSGLLVPTKGLEAESHHDLGNGVHYDWPDGPGHGDFVVPSHTNYPDDNWVDDPAYDDGGGQDTWDHHSDGGHYTDHIDHSDGYSAWGNWAGNWTNSPPSVSIEVE
jgi:hypothetical protein